MNANQSETIKKQKSDSNIPVNDVNVVRMTNLFYEDMKQNHYRNRYFFVVENKHQGVYVWAKKVPWALQTVTLVTSLVPWTITNSF